MSATDDVLDHIKTAYDELMEILEISSGEDNLFIDREIKDAVYNLNEAHYQITGCYI